MTDTAKLSKDDIAAIRKADDIVIHLNVRNPQGRVYLVKRKSYNAKPFEQDQEWTLPAHVAMENWRHNELVADGTVQCFAMAGIYHGQQCHVSSVLKTLRLGDELRFRFYADAHTNQSLEGAGFHGDVLYLDVLRDGKRVARWELDSLTTLDNTARMCRGIPAKDRAA